eukprot:CAMPEP_0119386674 /NCGR_PEP_ID=MMETSP1334-20130426/97075_1 /TAXON_ID=127549 /ORGANISM="Calcidiscus leptoporus, Strain RCC1130" /LENGTH=54 /DNA_ID=CAMNT_0007408223 /DNA_START=95 /DNA_END=259 /DNA_ORIENTATION=+
MHDIGRRDIEDPAAPFPEPLLMDGDHEEGLRDVRAHDVPKLVDVKHVLSAALIP